MVQYSPNFFAVHLELYYTVLCCISNLLQTGCLGLITFSQLFDFNLISWYTYTLHGPCDSSLLLTKFLISAFENSESCVSGEKTFLLKIYFLKQKIPIVQGNRAILVKCAALVILGAHVN